jgi:hypothetical protein
MGKDLHYSIRPFIEKALNGHQAVRGIERIDTSDFFAYKVERNFEMSDLVVVLSDDYHFGDVALQNKPVLLKEGGFYLIAKPEANSCEINIVEEKFGVGKIGKLLGALNKEEFWKYTPPKKDKA